MDNMRFLVDMIEASTHLNKVGVGGFQDGDRLVLPQ